MPILDPATDEAIGQLARATTRRPRSALAAAAKGFSVGERPPAFNRYKLMRKAADIFRQRAD